MSTVKRRVTRRANRAQATTCEQVTSFILDYVTRNLDPEVTSAFEEHLRQCPDCVAFLNTYNQTILAARSVRHEDIPPEMKRRVGQFLRKSIGRPPGRRRAASRLPAS